MAVDEFSVFKNIRFPFIKYPCIIITADEEIPLIKNKPIFQRNLIDFLPDFNSYFNIIHNNSLFPIEYNNTNWNLSIYMKNYPRTTYTKKIHEYKNPIIYYITLKNINNIGNILDLDNDEFNHIIDNGYKYLIEKTKESNYKLYNKYKDNYEDFIINKIDEFKKEFKNINPNNNIIFLFYLNQVFSICSLGNKILEHPISENIYNSDDKNMITELNKLKDIKTRYLNFCKECECPVCLTDNNLEMLKCCQNLICSICIKKITKCPYCRGDIVIYCLKNNDEKIKNILNNPNKSILFVYYKNHNSYEEYLENREYITLSGNYNNRNRELMLYKEKKIRILLLKISDDISGIGLQETTDIILMHKLSNDQYKQLIGRVLRIGRDQNKDLFIHQIQS